MSRQVKERVLNQIESGKCQRCGREILSRPDVSPSHSCKLEDIRNHLASFPPEKKEVGK